MRVSAIICAIFAAICIAVISMSARASDTGAAADSAGNPHVIEGITFVTIPGGTFTMGDFETVGERHEKPAHKVKLSSFEMSACEITNEQYAKFLNSAIKSGEIEIKDGNVYGKTGEWAGELYLEMDGSYDAVNKCRISYDNGTFTVETGKKNRPVVFVTWIGSKAFAVHYGFDLPREAEWEYACSGGKQYAYGTADGMIDGDTVNYARTVGCPVDVGSYPQNPFGLYDMSGNVWEWCNDWYGAYSRGHATNPTGPDSGSSRIVRGGGWYGIARYCRTGYRWWGNPKVKTDSVYGFRVVRRP